ncbi:hypothetical protein LOTGIDRAFT_229846 [Lottia gigantea]|uniref:C2H2-type domain-containing protein n=1 Tax=Lottia gigantea TaxID=225164 RepID=V3ZKG0_LOTGI|nr:hypothetical protein LOTGIDRAFT_229846 [Lottia gigantea]ESO82860.1 hypothetical protein LOTGIDRAFT_229846 [Lottia gigantea]
MKFKIMDLIQNSLDYLSEKWEGEDYCVIVKAEDEIKRCNRQKSRIVRNVINTKIVKEFDKLDVELPVTCPLHPHHDIYRIQESHKYMETISKWTCLYCGKAFVAEDYLDRHFINRHSTEIKIHNSTQCLADYCDVFRCDIIAGFRKPDFWDLALCMEDDMEESAKDCVKLMDNCIPKHITANETKYFKKLLEEAVCSYLTCNKYWEIPKTETPDGKIAVYVVLAILIAFGLVVYYCVFYQFYYTDTFSDSIVYDPTPRGNHRMTPYYEVRQRAMARNVQT